MANYIASARTNYFRVKDPEAFKAWAEEAGLEIWEGSGQQEGMFALAPNEMNDNGTLDLPWDHEKDEQRYFMSELAPHLADGSICVTMEAGAEKLRYIVGRSVAFNNKGEYVVVDISDIYERAKEKFGTDAVITPAEY